MAANAVRGRFLEGGASLLQPGRHQRGRETRTGGALWANLVSPCPWAPSPKSNLSSKRPEMESSSNLPNHNITMIPPFDWRSSASLPLQSGPLTHSCCDATGEKHARKTSMAGRCSRPFVISLKASVRYLGSIINRSQLFPLITPFLSPLGNIFHH